jgi:hypothetical protein
MRGQVRITLLSAASLAALAAACSGGSHGDEAPSASASSSSSASGSPASSSTSSSSSGSGGAGGASSATSGSAGTGGGATCSVDGNPGVCILTTDCAAEAGHTSTPGYCPGAADIECCTLTPNVADNPPTPAGWMLMMQSEVTPAMTAWAVMILNDPTMYPMFSTAMETFGSVMVLARVEWHPPDFQNSSVHRGVTLYVPG